MSDSNLLQSAIFLVPFFLGKQFFLFHVEISRQEVVSMITVQHLLEYSRKEILNNALEDFAKLFDFVIIYDCLSTSVPEAKLSLMIMCCGTGRAEGPV